MIESDLYTEYETFRFARTIALELAMAMYSNGIEIQSINIYKKIEFRRNAYRKI